MDIGSIASRCGVPAATVLVMSARTAGHVVV